MSAALTATSPCHQPTHPAPGAARSTSSHLLFIVQTLIAFGRRLAEILASHPGAQILHGFTRVFGTRDLGLIIHRIVRGLRMAEALEQRLVRNAREIDNPRFRLAAPRGPNHCGPNHCGPTQCGPATTTPLAEPDLSHLPTVEELADQIRRRPIGAVLADICRDLGVTAAHPAWGQIFAAVLAHRGNVVRLLVDLAPRLATPRLDTGHLDTARPNTQLLNTANLDTANLGTSHIGTPPLPEAVDHQPRITRSGPIPATGPP